MIDFWQKVRPGGHDGTCWVIGKGNTYGRYHGVAAHRFSWALVNGPIPEGANVLHRCDNPPCVRPEHLFIGSAADNMRDASEKGRLKAGPLPLTLNEAALVLGLKPATLRTQTRLGKLDAFKLGRDWYVQEAEVERYRAEHLRVKE